MRTQWCLYSCVVAFNAQSMHLHTHTHTHTHTQRSTVDEIERESKTDELTVVISYLFMFAYITLFLGHIRSVATVFVSPSLSHALHQLLPLVSCAII